MLVTSVTTQNPSIAIGGACDAGMAAPPGLVGFGAAAVASGAGATGGFSSAGLSSGGAAEAVGLACCAVSARPAAESHGFSVGSAGGAAACEGPACVADGVVAAGFVILAGVEAGGLVGGGAGEPP